MPSPLALALLLAPPSGELALQWRGLADCPDAAAVAREVEVALGRPIAPLAERPIVASGALERRPGAEPYVLILEVRRGEAVDRREFRAARCDALAEAAAVVLAAAIDPTTGERPPAIEPIPATPQPVTIPPPVPAPRPEPVPDEAPELEPIPPTPSTASRPEPRLSALLRAGPLLALGLVPGITGGVTGGLGLVTPRLRVDLDGHWFAPRSDDPGPPQTDLRIRVGGGAASLRLCARPRLGPIEFPTCLGGQVGILRAQAVGADIDQPTTVAQPWAALLVGAGLRAPFARGRLAVLLRADALVALARPRFGLAGLGVVYTAPSVAFQPALALEVKLP